MADEHLDVLIVGAGLSGVAAGYYMQTKCPGRSYAIVEGRASSGGTWDLFRYPGIRSDSDMYTLGFSFRPWQEAKGLADGPAILRYIRQTASEFGIDRKIRYQHRVKRASWSTREARWSVEIERADGQEPVRLTCNFLFMCCGYYDYAAGYTPELPGIERFQGKVVHPQNWTPDVEYANKRVVVIGSGATAVTLIPALAGDAAHVTMLQRSPSYVVARPDRDPIGEKLRQHLPSKTAHTMIRWRNVLFGMYFYNVARRRPQQAKEFIINGVRAALGPSFDVDKHFRPRYNPWDQRMCVVPNGDLFTALRTGQASVVTDEIETFTERGIKLRSGAELEADLIVTATGLNLVVAGDVQLSVDGTATDFPSTMTYKGMMFSDVPNFAVATGYTNASWTLKCELTCEYVCRMLNHMEKTGDRQCTPRNLDSSVLPEERPDLNSGYVLRTLHKFPKQGTKHPWKVYQNYARDLLTFRFGKLHDGIMEFSNRATRDKSRKVRTGGQPELPLS